MQLLVYDRNDVVTDLKRAVFEKGKLMAGKHPDLYRVDDYGNVIYYRSYGKNTPMGWQVDHIVPVIQGGHHYLPNLRPLQTATNKSLGGSLARARQKKKKETHW